MRNYMLSKHTPLKAVQEGKLLLPADVILGQPCTVFNIDCESIPNGKLDENMLWLLLRDEQSRENSIGLAVHTIPSSEYVRTGQYESFQEKGF
jgi:hypothetical protein